MEAPDKVYIETYAGEVFSSKWTTTPLYIENTEYIRKDALMEWIQEVRAIPHDNGIARDLAFQEVVNKLNSM